jgi:hypothetical protein
MAVVAFPDQLSEQSERCAGTLRELLSEAERGEIRALAVAYVGKGHEVATVLNPETAHCLLLGVVTQLQHDLLHTGDVPGIDPVG